MNAITEKPAAKEFFGILAATVLPGKAREDRLDTVSFIRTYLAARMLSSSAQSFKLVDSTAPSRLVAHRAPVDRLLTLNLDRLMPCFNNGRTAITNMVEHRTADAQRTSRLDLFHFNNDVMDLAILIDYVGPRETMLTTERAAEDRGREPQFWAAANYRIQLVGTIPEVERMCELTHEVLGELLK